MPDCVGVGVEIPLPVDVLLVVVVEDVTPPTVPTQAYVLLQRPEQSALTAGFHEKKVAKLILYSSMMPWHDDPGSTKWNLLQLPTMPSCIGVGVEMPLPLVLVGGGTLVVVADVGIADVVPTQA